MAKRTLDEEIAELEKQIAEQDELIAQDEELIRKFDSPVERELRDRARRELLAFGAEEALGRGEAAAAAYLERGAKLRPHLAHCAQPDVMERDGYTAGKKGGKPVWQKA